MRIAIEAQRIFRKKKHGMDFVALEMIRQLQQIDYQNEYFIFVQSGPDRCLHETHNFKIVEINLPFYPLWEQVALPLAIHRIKPDLLHCTSNTAPLFCSVPLVLTLHDIIFLEPKRAGKRSLYQQMGWYYRRLVVPHLLPSLSKIITVSNFEREHILHSLKLAPDHIQAVYNGFGEHFCWNPEHATTIQKYISNPGYILFLGNTDPKKNVPNTLQAYGIYRKRSQHPRPLLLVDMQEADLIRILKQQGLENIRQHITLVDYVPNAELPAIYSQAYVFLYTSLRESFGIPMLEAMACQTPVITSNTSAMPEIAGEAAILVDPLDPNSIAQALLTIDLDDPESYQQRVDKGVERTKSFSWDHTAALTRDVYQEITTKNR